MPHILQKCLKLQSIYLVQHEYSCFQTFVDSILQLGRNVYRLTFAAFNELVFSLTIFMMILFPHHHFQMIFSKFELFHGKTPIYRNNSWFYKFSAEMNKYTSKLISIDFNKGFKAISNL